MKIVDSMWSPACTLLSVVCDCGNCMVHATAGLVIKCDKCGAEACWSEDHAETLGKPLAVRDETWRAPRRATYRRLFAAIGRLHGRA